jgi:hypothetical protein
MFTLSFFGAWQRSDGGELGSSAKKADGPRARSQTNRLGLPRDPAGQYEVLSRAIAGSVRNISRISPRRDQLVT